MIFTDKNPASAMP